MSRPNLDNMPTLDSGKKNWDAKANQALEDIKELIEEGPFPLRTYGTGDTPPAASSFDRCLLVKNDVSIGWHLQLSDGSTYLIIPTQAAHVARLTDNSGGTPGSTVESTSVTVADNNFATILAKIDAIQDALEANGVMAGS